MSPEFAIWAFLTAAAFVVYCFIIMIAVIVRAHEIKMDALLDIVAHQASLLDERDDESIPLRLIDDVIGVEPEPRLIHIHHHHTDDPCEDWMLSIAGGVVPSSVLTPYPDLRNPTDMVTFEPHAISVEAPLSIELSDRLLAIFDDDRYPFLSLDVEFSGPSASESFAIRLDQIAFHLASVYESMSDEDRSGDIVETLNFHLRSVFDLNVKLCAVALAPNL